MSESLIYKDIAERTNGDIYIGVVGPVRTGKSTLIKRFMETLVLPNISNSDIRSRATDEMPQSASGRTVMTTEPKFVPDEAVEISVDDNASFSLKMIDCVGYIVPEAQGLFEDDQPRMVMTPWTDEPLPFEKAAEIGTHKVISEHSTIGIVVTTDGSFGDISRENFVDAEKRVIDELKAIKKPFIIVLNTSEPKSDSAQSLAAALSEKYKNPVVAVNCFTMGENDIRNILKLVLLEFPVKEISVNIPKWIMRLPENHPLKEEILTKLYDASMKVKKTGEIAQIFHACENTDSMTEVFPLKTELGSGKSNLNVNLADGLFYKVLGEGCGIEISGEEALVSIMTDLVDIKQKYSRIEPALAEVERSGYGIVKPNIEDLNLEEPEIIKQPGGYGVKLKATAPCLHFIKANVETTVSPIVGSERQSEDIVKYLLKEFEEDPKKIWESNMFGKSLHELVNEGLNTKLAHMPQEARMKLADTLQRIINEGSGGLICIIL